MSNISTAARVAIAFIRPFRSYLDGYALIRNKRSSIEEKFKKRMDEVIDNLRKSGYKVEENEVSFQKDFFFKISLYMLDKYEKSYDSILPYFIDELTIALEKELKNNFSENELEALSVLLENPVFVKLLMNKNIFALLKDCEVRMDQEIQLQIMESMLDMQNYNITKIIDDLKKKYNYEQDTDDFFAC